MKLNRKTLTMGKKIYTFLFDIIKTILEAEGGEKWDLKIV
jgi:hypothetical protein